MRDLSEMEQGAAQKANRELTVTRRVKVGGSR
jgi:hypothetical protein